MELKNTSIILMILEKLKISRIIQIIINLINIDIYIIY